MKAWHIQAYAFAADIYCPQHIEEWAATQLRATGVLPSVIEAHAQAGPDFDAGVIAHRAEGVLALLASRRELDRYLEESYDSDDFPKVIFFSDEEEKYCGAGHTI